MIESVTAQVAAYDYYHDLYQRYYIEGLRAHLRGRDGAVRPVHLKPFPPVQRLLGRLRRAAVLERLLGARGPAFYRALDRLAGQFPGRRPLAGVYHTHVGQYLFQLGDRPVKVCIDAHDSQQLSSEPLVGWSDLYFKTNYATDEAYPEHVRPFYNGNPVILPHLRYLRRLRAAPARYDLCFVVRIWGGANGTEKIEHVLRVLEAVARYPGPKFVLGFPVVGDIPAIRARLERAGIPHRTAKLSPRALWRIAAQSRLNLIRLGVEDCIPWRMVDLLAMGACTVLDQPPRTRWPRPLAEGEHFLSLDLAPPPGRALADEDAYRAIPDRLAALLADPATDAVRRSAAAYFDQFLSPAAVGRQLCEAVEAVEAGT